MSKICIKCNINKELFYYYNSKQSNDGKINTCIMCIKIKRKEQYHKNRKEAIASVSVWQKANKNKANANKKRWKDKNKAKVNMDTANRRANKLQRTPKWLTDYDWFIIASCLAV